MEIKRLGTTKLTVKFNTKHTNWDDTQTDFIGIEGEARSRCYSFKIQDAEGINFISQNVKMLFKERGSSKVYFSKAVWNPEEESYFCDIPGNILQKTQIIDIQVCIEDGTTRILTPIITKQVLSSLMSGAAAASGNDIYIDFENLNDIQKIIDSEDERKKNELERIEDSKRIKDMLDTNLDSELKKYAKVDHRHDGQIIYDNLSNGKQKISRIARIERLDEFADSEIQITTIGRLSTLNKIYLKWYFGNSGEIEKFRIDANYKFQQVRVWVHEVEKNKFDLYITNTFDNKWQSLSILKMDYWDKYYKIETDVPKWVDEVPEGAIEASVQENNYATKTELVSSVNLLNAKIDEKNKDCVTKAEYAKDKKRLNSTIAREKKLETLAGLILDELRKQNPDLKPVDILNVLKSEEDEE